MFALISCIFGEQALLGLHLMVFYQAWFPGNSPRLKRHAKMAGKRRFDWLTKPLCAIFPLAIRPTSEGKSADKILSVEPFPRISCSTDFPFCVFRMVLAQSNCPLSFALTLLMTPLRPRAISCQSWIIFLGHVTFSLVFLSKKSSFEGGCVRCFRNEAGPPTTFSLSMRCDEKFKFGAVAPISEPLIGRAPPRAPGRAPRSRRLAPRS